MKITGDGDGNEDWFIHIVFRLIQKTEDLEHLMNDEVTDINNMLKTINNLQVYIIDGET